jgi:amidase
MPFFAQELFIQAEAKGPLTDAAYLKARADCVRLSRQDGIDALLAKHKLDAIVTLTSGPAWFTDHVNGDQRHRRLHHARGRRRLPAHHRPGRIL